MTKQTEATYELQTPFYLDAERDPRHYLRGLQAWPGLPVESCKRHLKPADRKTISDLFASLEAANQTKNENDVVGKRREAHQLFNGGTEGDILRGETLIRGIAELDIDAYAAARDKAATLVQEGAKLASRLASEMADALLPEFMEDAREVESRLVRGGVPLCNKVYHNGDFVEDWELWGDFLIASGFAGVWFLKFYWPTEFISPKYGADPLAWLAEISKP
jgi:hypothetical protein